VLSIEKTESNKNLIKLLSNKIRLSKNSVTYSPQSILQLIAGKKTYIRLNHYSNERRHTLDVHESTELDFTRIMKLPMHKCSTKNKIHQSRLIYLLYFILQPIIAYCGTIG